MSGLGGFQQLKDTTPVVLDPGILGKLWGIAPTIDVTKATQNEIARNLSEQIAERIHKTTSLQINANVKIIDNLWGFDKLTELKLDNNCVEKIENIDHLVTLTSLDLSFNAIETLEGLAPLTNLTDLNVSSNKISKLEGLETLSKLEILMLGHNNIGAPASGAEVDPKAQIRELKYLRQFRELQMLTLEANPVAENLDCEKYVISHCESLMYYNFRLVDDNMRKLAAERFNDDVVLIRAEEAEAEAAAASAAASQAKLDELKAANLLGFHGLFEAMFHEDPDFPKWSTMPGLDAPLDKYRESFAAMTGPFKAAMLAMHAQIQEQVATFYAEMASAREAVEAEAIDDIAAFDEWRRGALYPNLNALLQQAASNESMVDLFDDELEHKLLPAIQALEDKLMEMEIFQVEQFDDAVVKFERVINDITSNYSSDVISYVIALRDMETEFSSMSLKLGELLLEQFHDGSLEDDIPQSLGLLLNDKEAFVNMISASHDFRLDKINAKDDEFTLRNQQDVDAILDKIRHELRVRNRNRVQEIAQLTDQYRAEKVKIARDGLPQSML
ncbi:LRRC48 protein [Thecamonas trahens ATCC 50062]|uniref:Dynein regulatory complex subunit 3 n=1 Tax=Thecamonas trahens ATCC 50062 TaxID=461836 RepID=A0A0L0DSB2_THETB|nr:LRRC48 protein [Thecamonas trahens ATCC 50062]KNC55229.1 LRRC48 protein [Thecamonas trahens ATCC 50062]|eukprot:XP_013753159.1 LRRC48 protein [Thecamonas trahens ATCC 50062]